MTQLPDKPSELIRLALADLAKVESDPKYRIDMSTWHTPTGADGMFLADANRGNQPVKCSVCLAGAVMAGTLGAEPDVELSPYRGGCDWGDRTRAKLRALDHFRQGNIGSALDELDLCDAYLGNHVDLYDAYLGNHVDVGPYGTPRFLEGMNEVIRRLETAGL